MSTPLWDQNGQDNKARVGTKVRAAATAGRQDSSVTCNIGYGRTELMSLLLTNMIRFLHHTSHTQDNGLIKLIPPSAGREEQTSALYLIHTQHYVASSSHATT